MQTLSCKYLPYGDSNKYLCTALALPQLVTAQYIICSNTPTSAHPVHLTPTNLAKNVEVKLIDLIKFGEPFSLQWGKAHTQPPRLVSVC